MLELLETKELKAITVKEICDKAGISRNAFYQHYRYKEDLYNQMVAHATERIRDSFMPVVHDESDCNEETIEIYVKHCIDGIFEVKDLIYVMLKSDEGQFLRQLTDLIYEQFLATAIPFFNLKDSEAIRLYYEFQCAGIAAFIIKWVLEEGVSKDKAASVLAGVLLQAPAKKPRASVFEVPDELI